MTKKQFALIGIGRFGYSLAIELTQLGHEVLAIDTNESALDMLAEKVTHVIQADASEEGVLTRIGIRNFDVVVVAIGDDLRSSMLISMLARDAGAKYIVAKASDELHSKILSKLGVDRVVYPEHDMGVRMAHTLSRDSVLEFIRLSDEYSLSEMKIPDSWLGKTLIEVNVRAKYGLNIVAIRKKDSSSLTVSPSPKYTFEQGDVMVAIASNKVMNAFENTL